VPVRHAIPLGAPVRCRSRVHGSPLVVADGVAFVQMLPGLALTDALWIAKSGVDSSYSVGILLGESFVADEHDQLGQAHTVSVNIKQL